MEARCQQAMIRGGRCHDAGQVQAIQEELVRMSSEGVLLGKVLGLPVTLRREPRVRLEGQRGRMPTRTREGIGVDGDLRGIPHHRLAGWLFEKLPGDVYSSDLLFEGASQLRQLSAMVVLVAIDRLSRSG